MLADEEPMVPVALSASLADRVVAVLAVEGCLTEEEILQRIPEVGDAKNIRRMLLCDNRTAMTDVNSWTLVKEEPGQGQELQLFEMPSPVGSCSRPNGRRRRSLKARAEICLLQAGHPMSLQELADRMGGDINVDSLKAQLSADDSFMRSDICEWALTRWGMRRYTSVKELVTEEVDRAGGSISLADLERNLTRDFTINLATLRQVSSTAPFTTNAGVVRRGNGARIMRDEHLPAVQLHRVDSEEAAEAGVSGASTDEIIELMGLR
ncbi:hypothetical protein [Streptomyces sp. RPT161]|uniref:hypothetical protein n=1 Tax=Streptomyces sp. RPT161 TaxID=3015993 RepID=UPI0022B8CFC7|nr:hypothetical protein [Streptomyces sp. RPT161]